MSRGIVWLGGMLASVVGALLAGSARADAPTDWDQVVAAAKQEGTLNFYDAQTGFPEPVEMMNAFEARYGIKVNKLEARGADLMERIRVEGTNNKVGGDAVLMGSTGVVPIARQGLLADHGPLPNLDKLVLQPWTPEEVPVYVIAYGICINTNLVPPDQEPKSWWDLTDPKWKGKILSDEMTQAGGGQSWFAVMLATFGPQFHEAMAKQDLSYSQIIRDNPKRVARGEFAMSIPFFANDMANLQGLPVKAVIPKEGIVYTPVSISVIKGAQHPNAARLFVNFALESQSQMFYAKDGYPVATKVIDESQIPPYLRFSVDAKLLGHADIDKQDERIKLASQIYGRK